MSHLVTTMCSHISSDISTNPLTNISFMINLHPRYLSRSPNLYQIFKGLKREFEFEAWWSNLTWLESSNTPVNIMKLIPLSYISVNMSFFQYLIINSLKNTKIDALENNMSKTHVIMKMVYVRVWESEIWLKVKWKWSENVGKKMTLWRLNISPQLKVLHVLMQPCIEFPELCDGTFFCWKISKWQLLFVVGSCVTTISISLCNNTSFSCLWLVLVWQPKVFM